jgi:hypothetical protein
MKQRSRPGSGECSLPQRVQLRVAAGTIRDSNAVVLPCSSRARAVDTAVLWNKSVASLCCNFCFNPARNSYTEPSSTVSLLGQQHGVALLFSCCCGAAPVQACLSRAA